MPTTDSDRLAITTETEFDALIVHRRAERDAARREREKFELRRHLGLAVVGSSVAVAAAVLDLWFLSAFMLLQSFDSIARLAASWQTRRRA